MKQLLALLAIVGMITFASCDGTYESTEGETEEAVEETAEEMVEEVSEEAGGEEMLAEHVCSDQCTEDNHAYLHGEKGHVCDESCGAM